MAFRTNRSPWDKEVHEWDTKTLNDYICDHVAGYKANFVGGWNEIMKLCTERDLLHHPRYFARTLYGEWVVRDFSVTRPLAKGETGPIAICRAVATLVGGKGKLYSKEQLNAEKDSSGHGRRPSRLREWGLQVSQRRKSIHAERRTKRKLSMGNT